MTIQLFVKKLRDDILHETRNYLSVMIEAFCKEMETICFLSNISWNILRVIFFLSTRQYL